MKMKENQYFSGITDINLIISNKFQINLPKYNWFYAIDYVVLIFLKHNLFIYANIK